MQIHRDGDLLCLVFKLGYNARSIILRTPFFSCNVEWLSLAKMQRCPQSTEEPATVPAAHRTSSQVPSSFITS